MSKSGLGVSAGVKGDRIGTGPKGAYVSGGRGGLYYRKYMGKSQNKSSAGATKWAIERDYEHLTGRETDEEFVDTGVTYPSNIKKTEDIDIEPIPMFPNRKEGLGKFYFIGLMALLVAFFSRDISPCMLIASIVFLGIGLNGTYRNNKIETNIKKVTKVIDDYLRAIENKADIEPYVNATEISLMAPAFYDRYKYHVLSSFITEMVLQEEDIDTSRAIEIKKQMNISDSMYHSICIRIFRNIFDRYMEDEHLDEQEEQVLRKFASSLNLEKEDISEELESIELMSKIRDEVKAKLEPIEVDIKLQKNEVCYYSDAGRKLKKKVLQSRTVNGLKIKKVGFVIEKEGDIYLTNNRLLMVASGTSTTKLEKILDVIVTAENNVAEVTVDGKKSPIYFSVPNVMTLGARIEKAQKT